MSLFFMCQDMWSFEIQITPGGVFSVSTDKLLPIWSYPCNVISTKIMLFSNQHLSIARLTAKTLSESPR